MDTPKTVLITGAAGNLGSKLTQHLQGKYLLRLLDIDPRGNDEILQADLSKWDPAWVQHFVGVDCIIHLAADPTAHQSWEKLIAPNIDAVVNVFQASAQSHVSRVVYASSNHAMGGYKDVAEPWRVTTDLPPLPGTLYTSDGKPMNSIAYGAAKLMGERIGKCFSDAHGMSVIGVRIGWVRPGENLARDIPIQRGEWLRLMWLSNRDFCQLMERCIEAESAISFAVINGMSANTSMRWDLDYTRQLVGYEPQDDVTKAVRGSEEPSGSRRG